MSGEVVPPADEPASAKHGSTIDFDFGILKVWHQNYTDDLTGQELPPELVHLGQQKELADFESKQVWELVPVAECGRLTRKPPITTRWVCTNKWDHSNPNVRCRLVARQIRRAGTESLFAPTPPLEALRTVLSSAATQFPDEPKKTWNEKSEQRMQLSFVDISREYFNAHVDPDEPTFVELRVCLPGYAGTCKGHRRQPTVGRRSAAARCGSLGSSKVVRALVSSTTLSDSSQPVCMETTSPHLIRRAS